MQAYALSKSQLRENLHRDVRLMLNFYIEGIDLEIPEMHSEIWDEFLVLLEQANSPDFVVGTLKKLLAIPREHAKTTLVKLAIVLFVRYSPLSFVAYVSNTAPVAMNAIRDVKDFLMSPKDHELFGPARLVRSSEQDNLFVIDITVPHTMVPKRVLLKAFGQGTQIRGFVYENKRPDLLVYDDIESRDTVESELQQRRLDNWATGTALKAMGRRGVCIFIGNMIGDTSLLARLSKDKEWNPTVLGSIIKTKSGEIVPLWPGRWSMEALIADYLSFVKLGLRHVWEAEMMNLTSEAILGESLESIVMMPIPTPDMLEAGFLAIDPAFGQNSWNDYTAITVHVRDTQSKIPMMVQIHTAKMTEMEIFDACMQLSDYWGITTWFIEAIAAQRLLIPLFKTYLRDRQLPDDFILFMGMMSTKDSKASRIVAFRSAVAQGSYILCQGLEDFRDKLESYTPLSKEKDDDLDSGAYGPICWATDAPTIHGRGAYRKMGALLSDYYTAGGTGNFDSSAIP